MNKFLHSVSIELKDLPDDIVQHQNLPEALQLLVWMPKNEAKTKGVLAKALKACLHAYHAKKVADFVNSSWPSWYLPNIKY